MLGSFYLSEAFDGISINIFIKKTLKTKRIKGTLLPNLIIPTVKIELIKIVKIMKKELPIIS